MTEQTENPQIVQEEVSSEENTPQQKMLYPPKKLSNEDFQIKILHTIRQKDPNIFDDMADDLGIDKTNPEAMGQVIAAIGNNYVEEQKDAVVAAVLNENIQESYNTLQNLCFFETEDYQYINAVEGDNASTALPTYIEDRLSAIPALRNLLEFHKTTNEAFANTNVDNPTFNIYKANQIREQLDDYAEGMTPENKAKINFISSKMYRKIASKANVYVEGKADGEELDCLRKVLQYTGDYKLVSYCENRLKPNHTDNQAISRAYKKSLKDAKSSNDLYKINNALARIYQEKGNIIGYTTSTSQRTVNLQKAENYYFNAYRHAAKDEKIMALKNIANVQWGYGNTEGWANTKTQIAMKHLKGSDRCLALIAIGERMKESSTSYFDMAIQESEKGRIPAVEKLQVQKSAYEHILKRVPAGDEKALEAQQNIINISSQQINFMYSKGRGGRR